MFSSLGVDHSTRAGINYCGIVANYCDPELNRHTYALRLNAADPDKSALGVVMDFEDILVENTKTEQFVVGDNCRTMEAMEKWIDTKKFSKIYCGLHGVNSFHDDTSALDFFKTIDDQLDRLDTWLNHHQADYPDLPRKPATSKCKTRDMKGKIFQYDITARLKIMWSSNLIYFCFQILK